MLSSREERISTPSCQLLALPTEVLLHLVKLTPRSILPHLAATCSQLRDIVEPDLWGELWLLQPSSLPSIPDTLSSGLSAFDAAARREIFRQATKKRILEVLVAGGKHARRFDAVHTVNATMYRYSTHHIVSILHIVREHLTTLRIFAAHRFVEYSRWGPHDGFPAKMADFNASFPVLTRLELGACHNYSYDQVLRLIALAPNLAHIQIAARNRLRDIVEPDPQDQKWQGLPMLNSLKTFIVAFPEDDGLPEICTEVLKKAPNLVTAVLGDIWADLGPEGWSDEEEGEADNQFDYFETLGQLKYLEHLDWRCGSEKIVSRFISNNGFEALKVLVVDGNVINERLERIEAIEISALPGLNTLVFRVRHEARPEEIVDGHGNEIGYPASDTTPRRIPRNILDQLHGAPNLHFVIFCRDVDLELAYNTPYLQWERVGMRGIAVSSFTNGIHELVHIRTLTRSRYKIEDQANQLTEVETVSDEDMEKEDFYNLDERLRWEHAVAYDGEVVTEEILEKAFEPTGFDWTKPPVGRRLALPEVVWNLFDLWVMQGKPKIATSLDTLMASLELPPISQS